MPKYYADVLNMKYKVKIILISSKFKDRKAHTLSQLLHYMFLFYYIKK